MRRLLLPLLMLLLGALLLPPRRAEAAEVSTPFLAPLVCAVAATAPPTRSVAPARRAAPRPLPHPRAARRASTDLGEARGEAARVGASHPEGADTVEVDSLDRVKRVGRSDGTVEEYGYNALGALKDRFVPIGERALAWARKCLDGSRPELATVESASALFLTHLGERLSLPWITERVRSYVEARAVSERRARAISFGTGRQ